MLVINQELAFIIFCQWSTIILKTFHASSLIGDPASSLLLMVNHQLKLAWWTAGSTIVVGYPLSSPIINHWLRQTAVSPKLFRPFLRQWIITHFPFPAELPISDHPGDHGCEPVAARGVIDDYRRFTGPVEREYNQKCSIVGQLFLLFGFCCCDCCVFIVSRHQVFTMFHYD